MVVKASSVLHIVLHSACTVKPPPKEAQAVCCIPVCTLPKGFCKLCESLTESALLVSVRLSPGMQKP